MRDKQTTYMNTFNIEGITHLIFKCSAGHMFAATDATIGCETCKILTQLSKINIQSLYVDLDCVYLDENSLLRFKCLRRCRHEDSYEVCGKEFIASKIVLFSKSKPYLDCTKNHVWSVRYGITNLIRLFEMFYDQKFADTARRIDIRFTGYNALLGVAFIHMNDAQIYQKINIRTVTNYCIDNGINLIIIPHTIQSSIDVIKFVITATHGSTFSPWQHLIPNHANMKKEEIIASVRSMFRENTRAGKLYPKLARIA